MQVVKTRAYIMQMLAGNLRTSLVEEYANEERPTDVAYSMEANSQAAPTERFFVRYDYLISLTIFEKKIYRSIE